MRKRGSAPIELRAFGSKSFLLKEVRHNIEHRRLRDLHSRNDIANCPIPAIEQGTATAPMWWSSWM
jgi:hypothetical protein